jgi:two-component system, chemotaxis family, protein-glutamate methylesterase/glutaminase
VLGVVLTGMGADGTQGARAIRDAGGQVIVQDQASSVVWGMPGAVCAAGLADAVYPIGQLAAEVTRRVLHTRAACTPLAAKADAAKLGLASR